MKNNNSTKLIALLVGLTLSALVACGKKGDTNNNQDVNVYQRNCPSCTNAGITGISFFSAQSQDYYRILSMDLSFSGANVANVQPQQQNNNYYANSPAMSYVGPVSAIGQLTISQTINSFCQLPAGQYSITTQQVGQWESGAISNLRIIATGPATVIALIPQGQALPNYGGGYNGGYGGGYSNPYQQYSSYGRVSGQMYIESVNSFNCQNLQMYLN